MDLVFCAGSVLGIDAQRFMARAFDLNDLRGRIYFLFNVLDLTAVTRVSVIFY